jgi:hypothetical protein
VVVSFASRFDGFSLTIPRQVARPSLIRRSPVGVANAAPPTHTIE